MPEPIATIKVTREHIRKGVPCTKTLCPIALALEENGYADAFVTLLNSSYLTPSGHRIFMPNARDVDHWIRTFDRFHTNEPITLAIVEQQTSDEEGRYRVKAVTIIEDQPEE